MGAPMEPVERAAGAVRLPHLPALDGLRGLAVAAVVVYHLTPGTLPGGFLGVDVFFVLSGFLITSLLLSERERNGRVSLRTFYLRRLRRLVPALLLVLTALGAYAAFVADTAELARLRSHGLASLAWVANWQFIVDDTSYTEVLTGTSPLRHMWSLAIEEQFYVVFPLLVIVLGIVTAWRGSLRPLLIAVAAVGAVASAVWMAVVYDPDGGIERAYFGTDSHAHGLLIGVVLGALLLGRPPTEGRGARVLSIAAIPAAAVVLGAFVLAAESAPWMYRGGFFAVGLAVAVVIAASQRAGWLRVALSWRPLVGLGLISYGVYLWHWPIIVLVTEQRVDVSGAALGVLQLALTLACALASYRLVEVPIRRGALGRRVGRAALLALPLGLVAVGAVLVLGTEGPRPAPVAQAPPVTEPAPIEPLAQTEPEDAAPADEPQSPEPLSLVVLGDSVAHTLVGGRLGGDLEFDPWEPEQSPFDPAEAQAWSVAKPACSFLEGRVLRPGEPAGDGVDLSNACGDWRDDLDAALEEREADVVLVALANDSRDRVLDGEVLELGSDAWTELLEAFLDEVVVTAVRHDARTALIVLPPRIGRFADPGDVGWREREFGEAMADYAADEPDADVIDLAEVVCPGGNCEEPTDGFDPAWRFDGMHYDAEGARWFADWVTPRLAAIVEDENGQGP